MSINLLKLIKRFNDQFQGVDLRNHPSTLPVIPRYALLLAIAMVVFIIILLLFYINGLYDQLDITRNQEIKLRQDYIVKLQRVARLNILKKQKKEIAQYIDILEKQLPGKAEIDSLLSDINQAGLNHNLQFELFKPGHITVKEYYVELPVTIKVIGRYHDIGAFTADIAGFSRIVILNELNLVPAYKKYPNQLTLNATVQTFRYLDPDEIREQREAKAKKGNQNNAIH